MVLIKREPQAPLCNHKKVVYYIGGVVSGYMHDQVVLSKSHEPIAASILKINLYDFCIGSKEKEEFTLFQNLRHCWWKVGSRLQTKHKDGTHTHTQLTFSLMGEQLLLLLSSQPLLLACDHVCSRLARGVPIQELPVHKTGQYSIKGHALCAYQTSNSM